MNRNWMIPRDRCAVGGNPWSARTGLTILALAVMLAAPSASAQGSRKDDIVLGPSGHPVAGATVRVCQAGATGTPCAPLATIYTDATLGVAAPNPFVTDGLGNYHFYAPPGRYEIQISGPGIVGTMTYPDTILPWDASSQQSGNDISAFSLNLGGNLAVNGNATITGTLTAPNFDPTNFNPTSLALSGSETVGGPRPRIDVTAYGAKGDGTTDDTTAIQSAINAACGVGGPKAASTIFFPPAPSFYKVTQPQTPSTVPIFSIPLTCGQLHFQGGNTNQSTQQFAMAPMVAIVVTPGASPNQAPVFLVQKGEGSDTQGGGNSTFENLSITGYNQAVWLNDATNVHFRNVCLGTSGPNTGTDHSPLKITDSIWVWYQGGCLITSAGDFTEPVALFTMEPNSGQPDGLFYFSDMITAGGGFVAKAYSNNPATGGGWHFRNVEMEDSATDMFTVESAGGSWETLQGVSFDNFGLSDSAASSPLAVLGVNDASVTIHDVRLRNAVAISSGNPTGYAIRQTSGNVLGAIITGVGANEVVDGSGNPLAFKSDHGQGIDIWNNTANLYRLQNNANSVGAAGGAINQYDVAGGVRLFPQGSTFAETQLDPAGLFMGGGTGYGYDSQLSRTGQEQLDFLFPATMPPTGVSATPTTGGSVPAGTYYYFVLSCADAGCSTESAPSAFSSSVVVSGSNNAVNVTWSLPPVGAGSVAAYRIFRSTSPVLGQQPTNELQMFDAIVTGGSTTSFTDLSSNMGCCMFPIAANSMTSVLRATPTGFLPAAAGQASLGSASFPFGLSFLQGLTLTGITGSTQCLHVNSSGLISGTGVDCGSGGGGSGTVTDGLGTTTAGQLAESTTTLHQIQYVTANGAAVGLGSVTNDAQTKAAVVPNTAPAAGQILAGNAGGTAYAPVTLSGDCTMTSAGVFTCTKTNGTLFAASATTDTTNATNISSGTLAGARMSAVNLAIGTNGGVSGILPVANGGTGTATPALVAGTNVTITGSWPNQTINSSGGGGSVNLCTNNPAPGAYTPTNVAGAVDCLTAGTYTLPTSVTTISSNNVTILGTTPGVIVKRGSGASGVKFTGNQDQIVGVTLDANAATSTVNFIEMAGTDDTAQNIIVQNPGTVSSAFATFALTGSASRPTVDNVSFLGTQVDPCIAVNPAGTGSGTVDHPKVTNINVAAFGPSASENCIWINQVSGSAVTDATWDNDAVSVSTTNGTAFSVTGQAVVQSTVNERHHFSKLTATTSVVAARLVHIFSCNWCSLTDFAIDDGGHGVSGPALDLGDFYNSAANGMSINVSGGLETGIACVDCAWNTFTGNTINGVGNGDFGIFIGTSAAPSTFNTVTGNVVTLGFNATCYFLQANGTSEPASYNNVQGNTCVGTNAASQLGLTLTDTTGGVVGNLISGNIFRNLTGTGDKGITIGSGSTNNVVGQNIFDAVTTNISDSGTTSQINTHSVVGSGALTSGSPSTLAVTFSGYQAFTTGKYQCNANDQTTQTNSIKVTYSGSTVTFTGPNTVTDTVGYQCGGY